MITAALVTRLSPARTGSGFAPMARLSRSDLFLCNGSYRRL